MSSGSQGSKNRDELGASPSHAPNKNQENLRPGDSWIPSGSLSSNNASKQPIAEAVGSDPVPCSVDRIQSYIGNECPEIYEYYSSIGKTMTDSRTKVCLEDLDLNHDQSCSVLKSDIEDVKCRRFCRTDCLEDINKAEHFNYLPAYCIPEQSTMMTEPVTSVTTPSVTTRITSSTTINPATESDSGNTLAIGLGAGLGGLLLIALVILGIYCFKNRKRAPKIPERPLPRKPDDNASGDYANPYQIEPDNGAYINEEVYETYGDAHIDQMKPLPGRGSEYVNSKYLKTVDTPHSVYYVTKK